VEFWFDCSRKRKREKTNKDKQRKKARWKKRLAEKHPKIFTHGVAKCHPLARAAAVAFLKLPIPIRFLFYLFVQGPLASFVQTRPQAGGQPMHPKQHADHDRVFSSCQLCLGQGLGTPTTREHHLLSPTPFSARLDPNGDSSPLPTKPTHTWQAWCGACTDAICEAVCRRSAGRTRRLCLVLCGLTGMDQGRVRPQECLPWVKTRPPTALLQDMYSRERHINTTLHPLFAVLVVGVVFCLCRLVLPLL